ncbi:hypothetical protein PV325_006591 [Microctonus aethiopoides]|uniref:Uncharacterized protein n=1 Tax=Microctonus aethiopoides TaxID=144406 RepID=A0AA39KQP3_9HYME|nr:hypothetical protein PV325_006591 [Microctonus aethiopoides]KAK0170202.1 hypothetical protein PV328_010791 [Microctonus aethiopoides]
MFLDNSNDELNNIEQVYAWWTSILILQMMTLTWCTGPLRVKNKTIHSNEDRMWLDDPNVILHPDGNGHPDIELIRSTHFNDLITIIPFLLLIILWQSTSPNYLIASNIIRGFALCKIFDTILRMKLINSPSIISKILLEAK